MLSFIVLNHSKTWCYWISYENAYYYEMRDKGILWKLRFFQINFYVFVKLQWYLMSLEWSSLVWCNLLDRLIIIGLFMTKQPKACNNGCHWQNFSNIRHWLKRLSFNNERITSGGFIFDLTRLEVMRFINIINKLLFITDCMEELAWNLQI